MDSCKEQKTVNAESWKIWFSHLIDVASDIAEEKRDLTYDEYVEYEKDGGGMQVEALVENITERDADEFVEWVQRIANRKKCQ